MILFHDLIFRIHRRGMIILLKIRKSLFLFGNEDYRHGKKAWTRGQCPRKLLRIVEIFGTWKIIYSCSVEKPYILGKILNSWQNYRLWTMISTIFLNFWHNFDMSFCGNLNFEQNVSAEGLTPFPCLPSNYGVSKNEHPRTAYDPTFLLLNPFLL